MPVLTAPTRKPVGFRRKFITSCLQPVFTVLIDDNTTLIKAVMTGMKFRLYRK